MYVKNTKRTHRHDSLQALIIFVFILISALISLLLPVYFASLPLR